MDGMTFEQACAFFAVKDDYMRGLIQKLCDRNGGVVSHQDAIDMYHEFRLSDAYVPWLLS